MIRVPGRVRRRIERLLLRISAKSPLLSSLYYGLFSDAFRREHFAVARGRIRYLEASASPEGSTYLLRRNIHRLEKGLLMRPRRPVFATKYIEETVDCYERVVRHRLACSNGGDLPGAEEIAWAHDVLATYFSVVGSHPTVDRAADAFRRIPPLRRGTDIQLVPYKRDVEQTPPVRYEDLAALARRRRSVRWYLQKPVPREMIDRAIEVAAQAPSACNRQPFRFLVFDDPELVRKVASVPLGTAGFYDNLPVIVVLVGELRSFFSERDRHAVYIDASLAAMSFVLALESQGLSSCCINWPDIEPQESIMAELLRLAPDERVIMLIGLGFPDPDGLVAYSQKRSLDELREYNRR